MMATLGFGKGISIGPAVKSLRGENFLSTSLSGPRRCSGATEGNFCRIEFSITSTLPDTSLTLSVHEVADLFSTNPAWLIDLLRGDNTNLSEGSVSVKCI